MKIKAQYYLLGLFALIGIFLMRGGISGYAVAEKCISEDISVCYEEDSFIKTPANLGLEDSNALSITGMMIIIISVAMVAGYSKARKERLSTKGFD